jgi:hypothetical protein
MVFYMASADHENRPHDLFCLTVNEFEKYGENTCVRLNDYLI